MSAKPANGAVRAGLHWLDVNGEKTVLLLAYVTCAAIVAVSVFRRYVFSEQWAWSTSIPAYMFLWLTWLGAAYGVKIRAHLSFGAFRAVFPRRVQYCLMQLDYLLFLGLASVVIVNSYDLLLLQYMNVSVVPGTDNVPSWWFYSATPVGWAAIVVRVLQNAWQDFRAMRTGAPLIVAGSMTVTE
jgi:TRAP-type C4-dicarboxylate transport system permease small subunit